jgi:tol-pal system protein YbgF
MTSHSPPFHGIRTKTSSAARWGGGGLRVLLVAVLLVPLAACATKADIRDLRDELRELSQRQEALLREIQADERVTRDSVRALGVQVSEHRAQMGRTLRDLEEQIIRIQELSGLNQQEIAGLRDQMERRPLTQQQGAFGGMLPPTQAGGTAQGLYDESMAQYSRGNFAAARMGLEEIVQNFPTHELAPSAMFYLADMLHEEDDLAGAIQGFLRIQQFHPDSDRVPEALFRVGMIHVERGEPTEARGYLERVVRTYPDTDAAAEAERALRRLGG